MKKLSTEQWINLAKEVHGEKYDYTSTMYSTAKTKLEDNIIKKRKVCN